MTNMNSRPLSRSSLDQIRTEKIQLYRSLFRGREDIFARRWEKGDKSGYTPVYKFDWDEFNIHRANGGRLGNFKNKIAVELSDAKILEHLSGQETLGIYPILPDNTSYFLVADFDNENWFGNLY
jgi:hypothetical protein